MLNQVVLIGRITKTPELRTNSNGTKFVGFTIAVNNPFNNNNAADFLSCYTWNKQAENLAKFVKKGTLISVSGRVSTLRRNNITETFISAQTIQFLERRTDENSNLTFNNDNFSSESKFNNTNELNTNSNFDFNSTNEKAHLNSNKNNINFDDDDFEIKWD